MLIAIGIIGVTIAGVFGTYFATRSLLNAEPDDETTDLAGKIMFRIAGLHGLVLALVFASEVVEYHQLSFESAIETNAVSDAFYDADRYGDDSAGGIQTALRAYLQVASTTEWQQLGNGGGLHSDGWVAWNNAYNGALDLVPATPRQEALRDNILTKIHLIAQNRDLREHHATRSLGAVFWSAALIGIVLIAVGFYPFPPKRDNLVLLAIYAGYTGLILFTIFAVSNPYDGPAALDPVFFEQLITEIGRS